MFFCINTVYIYTGCGRYLWPLKLVSAVGQLILAIFISNYNMLPQVVWIFTLWNKIAVNGHHSLLSLHESPAGHCHDVHGVGTHYFYVY
jgi:hypothetical protein